MSQNRGVELRIFAEPQQGGTYDDQLALARAAEDLGFSAFFRFTPAAQEILDALTTHPADTPVTRVRSDSVEHADSRARSSAQDMSLT